MSKQPETLRLAAVLEAQDLYHDREAAAELRRLHEVNAGLLEALKVCRDRFFPADELERDRDLDWDIVNAAIVKAEGEMNDNTHPTLQEQLEQAIADREKARAAAEAADAEWLKASTDWNKAYAEITHLQTLISQGGST